jgi:steroid delta-isomerase-like uncharacterized protein
MTTEEHKTLVRRYWREAAARGVLAVIDDYFAPDIVAHPPASVSPAPVRGRDAWKRFTSAQWGAFPDLTGTVEEVVAEGDRVALRLTARGTHTGPLMGLPPTGKPVCFAGMEIFRIQDGAIVESWGQFDALGLLQQLGAIPAPAPAPGAPASMAPAPEAIDGGGPPAPEAAKALVRRFYDEFISAGHPEVADELLAPGYRFHAPGMEVNGPEGMKGVFAMLRAAFPDWRETIEDVLAEGDTVVLRVTGHGTHRGEFMGLPPTGRSVTVGGFDIVRIEGGQLTEHWAVFDNLGLLQQLGAMPAAGG